jgi:hypothetical protein
LQVLYVCLELTAIVIATFFLYQFGGEYYDGAENIVFDDLLRWDPDAKQSTSDDEDNIPSKDATTNNDKVNKGQWTRIHTPAPHPPPRCAHTSIFYKDSIYVFGGECATAEKYHHYRDLWRLDIKKNAWEEVRARTGTPPRKYWCFQNVGFEFMQMKMSIIFVPPVIYISCQVWS